MWSKVSWAANPLGVLEPQTNSYTELATGLHYRDPISGEWRESDPSFELTEEGYAVAAKCQHQVIIAPDLNPPDGVVVDLQTPEGRRLRSGILGLNLFDPVSGKNLQIAAVREVAGTQVSSNEIVWFDAFEGLQADVRVRNERGAFHQDVLLRERLSAEQLQRLGFDAATVRLEVWTEFVGSPEPALERKVMDAGTNETLRADGAPEAVDERVDFGVMRLEWGSGKAFAEPEAGGAIRIFKEWEKLEGRQFLIESAGYEELQPLLESLPVKTAALDAPAPAARMAWHRAPLQRSASARKTGAQSIQTAQLQPPSNSVAVVLDYVILNSGITDYTFRGDMTYYLSAAVTASGTTTFEGGAVLKYAANASLNFYAPGVINWKAAPYRPCLFTAKDDNTVGENISGSTGNPAFGAYANPALNILNYQSATLRHFRVAYAQKAIAYHSNVLTFQDGQFVNCVRAISFGQGAATVRNVLFANVERAFSEVGYCSISAEHVTFGGTVNYPYTPAFLATPAVWSYPYSVNLKNCVLARLNAFAQGSAVTPTGEHNGFWKNSNPPFGDDPIACPEGQNPFADGGAGDYYLAQDSPFRDVGWATVNPGLAEALRQRTTTTPILHANVTWNSGNLPDLSRRSIQDDDFMPDLGYHYEVLDYIFHDLQTSTTVRLEGGVAVGVQGSDTGWGLRLLDGGHLESVGGPAAMNRIVSFQHVQESPSPVATTGYFARPGNVWLYHSGGTDTTRRMVFRFTDLAVGQGCGATVLSVAGAAPFAEVTFQDCHVRGGLVSVFLVQVNGPRNIRWVNNVWERATPRVFYYAGSNPSPYHQHPVTVDCRNNLFRDSYLPLVYQAANGTTGIWEVKDNLFDQTGNVATTDSAGAVLLQRSHNAATAGTVNNLGGTWYRTDLERDYVSGPRGEYYHPESGGAYSLAQLRDAGSRSAPQAGLYHHTTRVDQLKETGSTVDIGFHYIAVDAEGKPTDTDADGLTDYLEDTNGDGTYGPGDFANWNAADTDDDGMPDGWEWQHFKTFNRDGTGDFDGDGFTDAEESAMGTNPLSRGKVIMVVDNTMVTDPVLASKIDRLAQDLVCDGWRVLRHFVARGAETPGPHSYPGHPRDNWTTEQWDEVRSWSENNGASVREVRALIKADYDAEPNEVKTVFLIGHVPVPYAGDSLSIVGDPGFQGYRVYRAPTPEGPFVLATSADQLLTSTSYVSARPSANQTPDNYYMVRAVKVENTPVGPYVNMSMGALAGIPGTAAPYLQIVRGPTGRSVTLGQITEPVAISVDVLGMGVQPITYQWFKDGIALQNSVRISGADNRVLLIRGVQLGDAGSYHAIVSNTKGTLASGIAALIVNP